MMFKASVPAKLNLRLTIVGKKDNMHLLDMLVFPYNELCDEVEFVPNESNFNDGLDAAKSAKTECVAGITNIDFLKSYRGLNKKKFVEFYMPKVQAIAKELNVCGRLIVRKNIPLGAGLGGSSASIVGALKAMLLYAQSLGKSVRLDDGFLLSLGSDVPCMFKGGACRVRGIGEIVEPIEQTGEIKFEVKIARGGADSGKCYKLYDELNCMNEINSCADKAILSVDEDNKEPDTRSVILGMVEDNKEPDTRSVLNCVKECRNDLTNASVKINPRIGKLIEKMKRKHRYVVMSGSGSAVIGFDL